MVFSCNMKIGLLVAGLSVLSLGAASAETGTERMGLIAAPAEGPSRAFAFPDVPQLAFSTFYPADFVWEDTDETLSDFAEDQVFRSLSKRYRGYAPATRDQHAVSIYIADLHPERIAPAASTAVQLAARWGRQNFGVVAHDLGFGEVLGGDNSSGEMIVNRISVWRRGHQALILRQVFTADGFADHAETIATLAGSVEFRGDMAVDPVMEAALDASLSAQDIDFAFPVPGNWTQLAGGPTGTPLVAEIWYDAADPNGNGAMLVALAPPEQPVAAGQRPGTVPEQQMADLAGTIATVFMENALPETAFELSPRDMTSFAALDDITAFNRMYFIDVAVEGEAAGVISVEIVMPADGSTLVNASLSPLALDAYLLGTQHHVSFATGLVHEAIVAHAQEAARQQGWAD